MTTSRSAPWTKAEVELRVGWMEESQELLRGRQIAWHKGLVRSGTVTEAVLQLCGTRRYYEVPICQIL